MLNEEGKKIVKFLRKCILSCRKSHSDKIRFVRNFDGYRVFLIYTRSKDPFFLGKDFFFLGVEIREGEGWGMNIDLNTMNELSIKEMQEKITPLLEEAYSMASIRYEYND
ncbi:MAG: hypothetical protein V3V84_00600 [Candidatus Bathyarchaeia archaeon]